jgi:hypothetical protein
MLFVCRRIYQTHHRDEENLRLLYIGYRAKPAMVVITDHEANIPVCQSGFLRYTGYNLNEVLGRNPRLFNARTLPAAHLLTLWGHHTVRQCFGKVNIHNRKKDGFLYWESAAI